MRYRVRMTARAEAAFTAAADWYAQRAPVAATRFCAEVMNVQESLAEAPLRWAQIARGFRRIRVVGFPYSLIYTVIGDEVVVATVVHDRRRPGRVRGPCGG
jgi:plasmid stabilization system protein ParE